MKVSILIPVYNASPTFSRMLARVRAAALPPGCSREIVVIDDGSTDGFFDALEGVIYRRIEHAGKGSAIRTGIRLASGEIVLIQDGDLEYNPADYARILEPILSALPWFVAPRGQS